jgi:MoxR-like ATPase
MAERSVSAFNREYPLPNLQVFADRNRLEREETFELPAAARDRFLMEIGIEAPKDAETRRMLVFDPKFHDADALVASVPEGILDHRQLNAVAREIQNHVLTSGALERYVLDLWQAVRYPQTAGITIDGVDMDRLVQGGASPRGVSYLLRAARVAAWLAGRSMVLPEDLRELFVEVMAHRIFLDPVYELRRDVLVRALFQAVFETVPAPVDGS